MLTNMQNTFHLQHSQQLWEQYSDISLVCKKHIAIQTPQFRQGKGQFSRLKLKKYAVSEAIGYTVKSHWENSRYLGVLYVSSLHQSKYTHDVEDFRFALIFLRQITPIVT